LNTNDLGIVKFLLSMATLFIRPSHWQPFEFLGAHGISFSSRFRLNELNL